MVNRILDVIAAAILMGALACAGASPIPRSACDDPTFDGYDCGEVQ